MPDFSPVPIEGLDKCMRSLDKDVMVLKRCILSGIVTRATARSGPAGRLV